MITNAVRMGVRRVAVTGRSAPFAQNQRSMCKVAPHIREQQERFQQNPHLHGADNPTYLKGGTEDYVANIIAGVLIFTGMYKISNGLYSMSFGVNVLEIE